MHPRTKNICCYLFALVIGAVLCAILPAWLMCCAIGLCALTAAVLLLSRHF